MNYLNGLKELCFLKVLQGYFYLSRPFVDWNLYIGWWSEWPCTGLWWMVVHVMFNHNQHCHSPQKVDVSILFFQTYTLLILICTTIHQKLLMKDFSPDNMHHGPHTYPSSLPTRPHPSAAAHNSDNTQWLHPTAAPAHGHCGAGKSTRWFVRCCCGGIVAWWKPFMRCADQSCALFRQAPDIDSSARDWSNDWCCVKFIT